MNIEIRPQKVTVEIDSPSLGISVGGQVARELIERDPYDGDYTVTPSAETQVLATNGFRMTDNVTIAPIPKNWGLITTDGSVITVS